jgi:AraC-like DNA-binding protein
MSDTINYFLELQPEEHNSGGTNVFDKNQVLDSDGMRDFFEMTSDDRLKIKKERLGELYKQMKFLPHKNKTLGKEEFYINEKFPLCNEEWLLNLKRVVFDLIVLKKYTWATITRLHDINQSKLRERLFRITGFSLVEFQKEIQFKLAARLLEDKKNLSIGEISKMIGFQDRRYFSKQFKKYYLMSPRAFREGCHRCVVLK